MIIDHHLGVLRTVVLNLFVVAEARVVLKKLSFWARCSKNIVIIKKACYVPPSPSDDRHKKTTI